MEFILKSVKGQTPIDREVLLEKIARGELTEADWIWIETSQQWIQIGAAVEFQAAFTPQFWQSPLVEKAFSKKEKPIWVYKSDPDSLMQGPVSTLEVLQMMRKKDLNGESLLWMHGMPNFLSAWKVFAAPIWKDAFFGDQRDQ